MSQKSSNPETQLYGPEVYAMNPVNTFPDGQLNVFVVVEYAPHDV